MNSFNTKARLRAGAATLAVVTALSATSAGAQCTTDTSTVTCTGTVAASAVNTAINGATPPGVTVRIGTGATVTRDAAAIQPNNPPFVGAIDFGNAGTLGTAANSVGFTYIGTATAATNTLALSNSGTITGPIQVFNVGGAITAANTGTLAGGLTLFGSGNITLNSSGPIYVAGGGAGTTAIQLQSFTSTNTTTGTVGTNAQTTNTASGGLVAATINAPVAIPAAGATPAVPQGISIFGLGGAQLTLNAAAGAVTVQTGTSNSSFTPGGGNVVTAGGTTTTSNSSSNTGVGGAAIATLGADGRATSVGVFSGPGGSTASIAGIVGSATAAGNVSAASTSINTASTSQVANSATASSSQTTSQNTPTGGAAVVDIAATGKVFGSATANTNAGAATVTVAGTVGDGTATTVATLGNVSASTVGTSISTVNANSNTFATGDFANSSTTTRAATGGAARATVAATGAVFGSVSATGDAGAAVDNAGRVRDSVTVTSQRNVTTAQQNAGSQVTTPGAAGASTVVNTSSNSSTNTTVGGTGTPANRAGAVIEDNLTVNALGAVTLDNSGAVFGNVNAASTGTTSTNSFTSTTTTATTPVAAGGNLVRTEQVTASANSSTATGGTVTGSYSGTVGAAPGSTLNTGFRSVNQTGQAGSTATIGGTLYADFTANSGAINSTGSSGSSTVTTTQAAVAPATPASETVGTNTNRNATTVAAANNTVTVTGSLRNNGSGTGNLSATTVSGTTAVTVNGGLVQGSVSANAGNGSSTSNGSDFTQRATTAATTAGPAAPSIPQSSTSTSFNETRGAAGAASVTLTNATVNGNVSVAGRGTGAGTPGASATIGAGSTVGGFLSVSNQGGADVRTDSSTVNTRTAANAVNQVNKSTTVQTVPSVAGNADATIAGSVAGAQVFSPWGNGSATLTGQITGTGSISVFSGATLNNATSDSTLTGTSTTTFAFPTQTAGSSTSSSTYRGGSASLAINSAAALQTAGTSAVNGSIQVSGVTASTLTIAAGTRVIQTNAGSIFAGNNLQNTTNSQTGTFTAGVQTGQVTTSTATNVGGPASITNAGIIGASTGFLGAPVSVTANSVGGASVTNSGTIYGSIIADAQVLDSATTTTTTGLDDAVLTRTVTTTTNTGVGGAAAITNSGTVSGSTTLRGATGTLANTGVIRGTIRLGDEAVAANQTQTATATTATTAQTAPATRFAQTYTVNQNGLLINGVTVFDPTVVDGSTGAAATARLQTSTITANVNLGSNSITTGNITAARAADNVTRLTNTTVTLAGAGTLGVGTADTPSAALGTGAGPLRFVNTANYAAYAGIDPALGNSASGIFVPSVGITSGSRVLGATLVEKTGTGVFTVVGSPYLAPTNGNAQATYTMDVGTFRISGGEVQLGVAGADAATGASIFGIRGNVENNAGTLLLGRRVTDGNTSVVQGTAVRVDGNYTQASGGTLTVAVAPSLIRANGTGVGAQAAQGVLGFGDYGVALTPFVAFDPTTTTSLRSTPSSLTVNGNATLAGTVALAATPGAIYTAGRSFDLLTVSGTYNGTGLSVTSPSASPFVRFQLTPRTVGTSTIVAVEVARTPYASVATNSNAAAAAGALNAAIPNVIARITAIPNPNAVTDVQAYGRLQDLATVIAGLDTQLSAADAATALNQLGSGSVYGSLAAVSTTAPFGEAEDTAIGGEPGVSLWLRPSGRFARYDGDSRTGAGSLKADTYGGTLGFGVTTGTGAVFGIAGGYSRTDARDRGFPSKANADTYMAGVYGHGRVYGLDLAAQAVFGWSNWDTTRALPLFSRTATASFDSKEFRISGRVGYDFALGGAVATPFGKIEARRYNFEAFEERNAGGIGLAAAKRTRTVVSPEAGLRIGGDFGGFTPFVEGSYVFQGDVRGYRDVAYLGDPATAFRLEGVDPDGFAKLGAGITANAYGATFSLRGNYLTGGGNKAGEVLGGISFRF